MNSLNTLMPPERSIEPRRRQQIRSLLVSEAQTSRRAARATPTRSASGALMFVGKTMMATGTLILLFVGYQLFGTNIVTNQQQKTLASELEVQWTSSVAEGVPDLGEGAAKIQIPKIGVDLVVVEGVGVEDLKKGPGHYPGTAMPGESGNAVISGHRTTYGAPFSRLDELTAGDEIIVSDASGPNKYLVTESKVVKPTAVEVLDDASDARLTLTTCHPKFSAKERLIVVAQLVGTPKTTIESSAPSGIRSLPDA